MKLTHKQLLKNIKKLNLIDGDGTPVLYSQFKNRATIHRYGSKWKIVFIGLPKVNLFGFYVMYNIDSVVMKEAYNNFIALVHGDMELYKDEDVQWGNAGIPIVYGNLRTI